VDQPLAGTKGELAIKLYGPDCFVMGAKAKEITAVLQGISVSCSYKGQA
jgi:Cu/Ag efflux pump CusA